MLYLDASLLVADLTNAAETRRMQGWLSEQDPDDLVISDWVVAEFSAALPIKLRTGEIEARHRANALTMFTRLCNDNLTVCRYRGYSSAWRRVLPTSMRWACAPEMLCISPLVPRTALQSVHSIGALARRLRHRGLIRRCCIKIRKWGLPLSLACERPCDRMFTIHSEGSPIAQRRRPKLPNVRFGTDDNQVRHTFRHTDRLGLDRDAISNAIRADLARQGPVSPGGNISGSVSVGGVTLEYRAFALTDDTINVGRITGP